MSEFFIRIHFLTSRSKNFEQAVKLAKNFSGFIPGPQNIVAINIKEVFEKWEYFNLLFWATVDWKGMTLEIDGMNFHSHSDKTRIFYALQHSHLSYLCFLETKYRELHWVESGAVKYEELDQVYTETEMNTLIDTFQIRKRESDVRDDEDLQKIKARELPWFLRNKMTPEDLK